MSDPLQMDKRLSECDSRGSGDPATTQECLTMISESMKNIALLQNCPRVELDTFSGDPLQFNFFMSNFKDVVENTVFDQRGRLARLLKYTSGEPKDLIRGFVHEDSSCCYDKAIEVLQQEYSDQEVIASSYMRELRQWSQIKPNDPKAFRSMFQFLARCNVVTRLPQLVELR